MIPNRTFAIILSVVFLLIGIWTLPHYGINWDTINHAPRGQSYLRYFLTGEKDFSSLPQMFSKWEEPGQWYWQKPESLFIDTDILSNEINRVSLYQKAGLDFTYFIDNDGGHPPLSDILSSAFNLVLFQKLGLINDIDSYRIYGIFLASLLVGVVFYWASSVYGRIAGLVAVISLATYPLFWSESHFNTEKDIPEAVYLSFFFFSVWKAVNKFSIKWALLSGVFWGMALGTKFNAVFAPFVVIPWIIYFALKNNWHKDAKKIIFRNSKFFISILISPIIGLAIFIASWPYLWADPISRLFKVVGFYKGIGLTTTFDERYLFLGGFNSYPTQAILYTTPISILVLFTLGVLYIAKNGIKEKHGLSILLLIGFVIIVGRVTWPGMSIYGGLRQIMEYIPAMATIAGLGGLVLYQFLYKRLKVIYLAFALVLVIFIPHLIKFVQIHPNENVYFNELIRTCFAEPCSLTNLGVGGLSGAKQKDFIFWGNSFGSAYRQGVVWINDNAVKDSKVALARELMPNIPIIWFRRDLSFSNGYRSGYLRRGEYVIGLTYQGTQNYSYFDSYLEKFLNPVYQVKVDNVAILQVWKNDEEHLKVNIQEEALSNVKLTKDESGLTFDIGEVKKISRLEIEYNEDSCSLLKSGLVLISTDGRNYEQQWGALPRQWRIAALGEQPREGHFIEPFLGQEARFIRLILSPEDTCLRNVKNFRIYIYK